MNAELLRRAADLIEQRAEGAAANVCPDWAYRAVRHIVRNVDIDCGHDPAADDGLDHDGWNRYDGPWIALMGPQVAAPLAAWLRDHAAYCEAVPVSPVPAALAVARAILGEQP